MASLCGLPSSMPSNLIADGLLSWHVETRSANILSDKALATLSLVMKS